MILASRRKFARSSPYFFEVPLAIPSVVSATYVVAVPVAPLKILAHIAPRFIVLDRVDVRWLFLLSGNTLHTGRQYRAPIINRVSIK